MTPPGDDASGILRSMDRRDSLDPRRILAAVDPSFDVADEPTPETDAVVLRFARQAMATTFEVVLPLGTPAAHEAALGALDEIDRLEQQMTVYRDDSEVSLINALAGERPIRVEESLFDLFERCLTWNRETRGAFDIAAGAIVKCWGFHKREGRMPSIEERRAALERSGSRRLELDRAENTIRFRTPGVEINLGSVGKGHAVDRAIRLLRSSYGLTQGLIHGGHSSVFAMGAEPESPRGWLIGLADPENPARRLGVFRLKDRGLGISAATHQHFKVAGKKLGHVLDPRIAWPAEGTSVAAVTAPTAAEADALATGIFILGPAAARDICARRPDLGAVLLTRAGLEVIGQACQEFESGAGASHQ